jgi:hypothetical protein
VEPLNVPAEHGEQTEEPAARIFIIAAATTGIRLQQLHATQTVTAASVEVHSHADVLNSLPKNPNTPVELE